MAANAGSGASIGLKYDDSAAQGRLGSQKIIGAWLPQSALERSRAEFTSNVGK